MEFSNEEESSSEADEYASTSYDDTDDECVQEANEDQCEDSEPDTDDAEEDIQNYDKQIHLLLKKCRKYIKKISSSSILSSELRKLANEQELNVELILDMRIRWNSTFKMLQRLLLLKRVLMNFHTLSCSTSVGNFELSDEEWRVLDTLSKTLDPINDATELLSGRNYSTLAIAAYMNPETNIGMTADEISVAKELIINEVTSMALSTPSSSSNEHKAPISHTSKFGSYLKKCGMLLTPTRKVTPPSLLTSTTIKQEISLYSIISKMNYDLSLFWLEYGRELPLLSTLVKKYLAIPATSVASESTFSQANNFTRKNRLSLTSATTRLSMFLKDKSQSLQKYTCKRKTITFTNFFVYPKMLSKLSSKHLLIRLIPIRLFAITKGPMTTGRDDSGTPVKDSSKNKDPAKSTHEHAPEWSEKNASHSEATIKADKFTPDTLSEELLTGTIVAVERKHKDKTLGPEPIICNCFCCVPSPCKPTLQGTVDVSSCLSTDECNSNCQEQYATCSKLAAVTCLEDSTETIPSWLLSIDTSNSISIEGYTETTPSSSSSFTDTTNSISIQPTTNKNSGRPQLCGLFILCINIIILQYITLHN
ncbi:unnamed protein product [Didymodactylos carnosus]|uniref:HAT C-terminal dimerisation domain-containing protein n=1 Tax=Didymodactylos carnosus TaxID=1234261 RepID=A0A813YBA2_9BILA|nr:unnamed protein product [Didymodactylos carnosus]CAF3667847.1 unnamed protein product [Didymodactylos carnosus]